MREIKFRAWNEKTQEMELLDSLFELQKMNLSYDEYNNLKFMQCTGLEDMYGKEIFEGDVIVFPNDEPKDDKKYIVYFDQGCFRIYEHHYDSILRIHVEHCEIVGNEYENPELFGKVNE